MITKDNHHEALDEIEKLIVLESTRPLTNEESETLELLILGVCRYEQTTEEWSNEE